MKALITVCLLAGVAMAASPHFVSASGSLDSDGDLVVKFKIAGLGDAVTTLVEASSTIAIAEYACRNRGGAFPSDPKKQSVSGPVTAAGEFTSGKNGSITATLVLEPPASTLDCPGGQRVVLTLVRYSDVTLTSDLAGALTLGDFKRVFFVL